ncbi:hypothetical protein MtrunA17_Chr2g0313021 [Medicago truncatula]|uniref:Transmembrane protein n=1 Tax=Medicago truncatula TaxID=3880 RepID=A0A396JE21_MEDTR|nr:hypothetical protein MtrunA17_Chr2g0313021 [Medicago truncatula]
MMYFHYWSLQMILPTFADAQQELQWHKQDPPMGMGTRMSLPVEPWETKHSDHQLRSGQK